MDELNAHRSNDHDLLIRISTQVAAILERLDSFAAKSELENVQNACDHCRMHLVTQEEFKPVRAIAFGLVSLLLAGVIGALLTHIRQI